jgi:hypothetical protein
MTITGSDRSDFRATVPQPTDEDFALSSEGLGEAERKAVLSKLEAYLASIHRRAELDGRVEIREVPSELG